MHLTQVGTPRVSRILFKQLYGKVYNYIFAGDYDKTPDIPTFADGHYEMLLCEAIEQSAREKSWVKVK